MRLTLYSWLAFIRGCSIALGQTMDLQALKSKFDKDLSAIEMDCSRGQAALVSVYTNDLQFVRARVQKTGDLDKLKAVVAEMTRAETERTLPTPVPDVSEIKALLTGYQPRLQKLALQRAKEIVKLAAQYERNLEVLQKKLTQEGRLDEATSVQEERKGLPENATVSEAKALLGKSEAATPSTSKAPRSETRPEKAVTAWDVRKDFSWARNPNGPWSYGWNTKPGSSITRYRDNVEVTGARVWMAKEIGTCPNVSLNGSKARYGVQPNAVSLHPGPSGQSSVARWTSPFTGKVTVQGVFGAGDSGIVDVTVLQDKRELFKASNSGQDESFSVKVDVKRGDKIDFMVGAGIDGYQADSTSLEATITTE